MEVILTDTITNLGEVGDQVTVKTGYGRNYLIPTGKAVPSNSENKAIFDAKRAELEAMRKDALSKARDTQQAIEQLEQLSVKAKAGEEGKLFGSIGAAEIVEALQGAGITIEKQQVRLENGPLRHTGEHELGIHLHAEVDAGLKLTIEAEE